MDNCSKMLNEVCSVLVDIRNIGNSYVHHVNSPGHYISILLKDTAARN
jgi:hypothetical protein